MLIYFMLRIRINMKVQYYTTGMKIFWCDNIFSNLWSLLLWWCLVQDYLNNDDNGVRFNILATGLYINL